MKKTEILVITDRSGSMASIASDVVGGYNTFLRQQKALPGEVKLTYTQFDDKYEVVQAAVPLVDVPELVEGYTFVPRGGTALLDAIGRTLNEQGARIKREAWAELVVVCIITDGEENSSHEFTREQIKAMTAHAEANGWKFIFLAANQDAFETARNFGSSAQYAGNFAADSAGVTAAYASTGDTVRLMRSGVMPQNLVEKA